MKKTALDRRLKELDKELSAINSDVRSLARKKAGPARDEPAAEIRKPRAQAGRLGVLPQRADISDVGERERFGGALHDQRFLDYMSTNFKPAGSMRRERRVQRNKAIVTLVFLLLLIVLLVYRFLL